MTRMAITSRMPIPLSDAWKAWAVPWKLVVMEAGGVALRVGLLSGFHLRDDLVGIVRGEDGGDLPRTVGAEEGVLDLLRGDAHRLRLVPFDLYVELRVPDLQVARHVLESRDLPHPGQG